MAPPLMTCINCRYKAFVEDVAAAPMTSTAPIKPVVTPLEGPSEWLTRELEARALQLDKEVEAARAEGHRLLRLAEVVSHRAGTLRESAAVLRVEDDRRAKDAGGGA